MVTLLQVTGDHRHLYAICAGEEGPSGFATALYVAVYDVQGWSVAHVTRTSVLISVLIPNLICVIPNSASRPVVAPLEHWNRCVGCRCSRVVAKGGNCFT